MRRIVTLLLSTCLVLSLSVPAFANTKEEEMSKHASDNTLSKYGIATQEDAMPLISEFSLHCAQSFGNTTLDLPARAKWVADTSAVLEDAYDQNVIDVVEDSDYIIFYYDYDESKLEDGQLLLTKYLKPESSLGLQASLNTKMNYAWGWSQGYSYKNNQKSALASVATNILLTTFTDKVYNLGTIFSDAVSVIGATADYSRPITATNWVKFYYCNKIGCVQAPNYGYWLPYAYVGERRAFDKVESIIYDTAGQPHTKSFVEENGIPSNNPTNSKKVQKKSHYDDDAWIIRTAISQYENDDGVYSDKYRYCPEFQNDYGEPISSNIAQILFDKNFSTLAVQLEGIDGDSRFLVLNASNREDALSQYAYLLDAKELKF